MFTTAETYQTGDKIFDMAALAAALYRWRVKDNKIVFTNGCFDILHPGHVDYLEKAAGLGSKLVIGLNSDASVKGLKGSGRPVLGQEGRAKVLAALEFVDGVVIFDEPTPLALIKFVLPDVLVKGNDYQVEDIVGYQEVTANGGAVKTIPLLEGYSTTGLITKIRGAE